MKSDDVLPSQLNPPHSKAEPEKEEEYPVVQFCPPLYLQRYTRVAELLQGILLENIVRDKDEDKTILDVGCGNLSLHSYVHDVIGIGKLIYLDTKLFTLESSLTRLLPNTNTKDNERTRKNELVAEVYNGDITQIDPKVLLSDPKIFAVTAIEVIEHLEPDSLSGFENSIFGILKPSVVFVTTPNFEFNVFFKLESSFRHWDHQFEWTRAEFNCWCESICEEYPEYSFQIEGVGTVDEFEEKFGSASQLAIFQRNNDNNVLQKMIPASVPNRILEDCYKLVMQFKYDRARSEDEIIVEVFTDFVDSRRAFCEMELSGGINAERTEMKIPLDYILRMEGMHVNKNDQFILEKIRAVLEGTGYKFMTTRDDKSGEIQVFLMLSLPPPRDDWLLE